jgi:hypothetical protein
MNMLLGNLNAKVGREDIFKQTVGNESLHKISNDNGVRLVNSVVITVRYHCYQLHTTFYRTSISRLSSYVDEIIGDHQCGFQRNRLTTDQVFYIR